MLIIVGDGNPTKIQHPLTKGKSINARRNQAQRSNVCTRHFSIEPNHLARNHIHCGLVSKIRGKRMSKFDSPKRTLTHRQQLQREADRRVRDANYIISRHFGKGKYNIFDPLLPPYEVDELFENILNRGNKL